MKKALWTILFLLLWTTASTFAQECPDYVAETLAEVANTCANMARNELCYGNTQLTVESNADLIFENPGDIINVADIQSLNLSGAESGAWGVALMNLQANLPETLPGQNVTVLLFGNVELARTDESLQSFYFSGGIGQPNCNEAPNGIILQSPEGYQATMTINGAELRFGSTIFLQQNEDSMNLSTLAGVASIEANGQEEIVLQGSQSSIALDSANQVSGSPNRAESLDTASLTGLAQAVNASGLMLPTYEDAAANPVIQTLVQRGQMSALDAENPLNSIDNADIFALTSSVDNIQASLDPNAIHVDVGSFSINNAGEGGELSLEFGPIEVISGGASQTIGEDGWTTVATENGLSLEIGSIEIISPNEPSLTLEFGEIKVISGNPDFESDGEGQVVEVDPESHLTLEYGPITIISGGESIETEGEWETVAVDPETGMELQYGPITVLSGGESRKLTLEFGPITVLNEVPTEEVELLSGRWVMVEQHQEVTGTCLDSSTNGDNGGGVIEQDEGRPICPLADGSGIIFQDGLIERLGTNLFGSEYSGERPNYSAGEGTITETMSWHYQVISPTRIVFTFTISEKGGCSVVTTIVYELAEADSAACDGVDIGSNPEPEEETSYESYEILSGDYSSDDLYVTGCEGDFGSQFENIALTVQEDSLDLSAGDDVYNLPAMGTFYMFYENTMTISVMALEEGTMSFTFADGACMVAGNYTPSK